MRQRCLVGIDLGVKTAHAVVVLDEQGRLVARRRCVPTLASLERIEADALEGAAAGTVLEVVIEPTGAAWLPVAVFFIRRGHRVFRVSSAKASAFRRFLSRYAKSNRIDAEALARLPLIEPDGLVALELPDDDAARLRRRVRSADRLVEEMTTRKQRIRELARQCYPMLTLAITGEIAKSDIAVLCRWPDPHRLLAAGRPALRRQIQTVSRGAVDVEQRVAGWWQAATEAAALYGHDPAVAFDELGAEIVTQARLLEVLAVEQRRHAERREALYVAVDPKELARSLPGIAATGGPVIVAAMGRPGRFPNGAAFKAFCGLTPKASETGETDSKGQAISKAGAAWLRDQLLQSANTARRLDPQLAAIYHHQMIARGAHHQKALTVVAARLAERAWTVMARGTPYVICDLDGTPVDPTTARQLIAEHYTVPPEVRAARRSRKPTRRAGKAPHPTTPSAISAA